MRRVLVIGLLMVGACSSAGVEVTSSSLSTSTSSTSTSASEVDRAVDMALENGEAFGRAAWYWYEHVDFLQPVIGSPQDDPEFYALLWGLLDLSYDAAVSGVESGVLTSCDDLVWSFEFWAEQKLENPGSVPWDDESLSALWAGRVEATPDDAYAQALIDWEC